MFIFIFNLTKLPFRRPVAGPDCVDSMGEVNVSSDYERFFFISHINNYWTRFSKDTNLFNIRAMKLCFSDKSSREKKLLRFDSAELSMVLNCRSVSPNMITNN